MTELGESMQERFTVVAGVRTRYYEAGAGDTLLLLHGGSLGIDARSTFEPVFERLSQSFHVVAPDLAGFGATEAVGPPLFVERTDRIDHAVAFLDGLGVNRAAVLGHSEGAFVAMRVAHDRPDVVHRLILLTSGSVAPALGGDRDAGWIAATDEAYGYHHHADLATMAGLVRHLVARPHPRLEELVAAGTQAFAADGRLEALLASARRLEADPSEYMRIRDAYIEPCLAADIPTLLLWSDADATVPVARAVALQQQLASADLVVLRDTAHMIMWDRPEAFSVAVTAWLQADEAIVRAGSRG